MYAPEFVKIAHFRRCWHVNSNKYLQIVMKLWHQEGHIETQFEFGRNLFAESGLSAAEFVKIIHFRGCWHSNLNKYLLIIMKPQQ